MRLLTLTIFDTVTVYSIKDICLCNLATQCQPISTFFVHDPISYNIYPNIDVESNLG